MPDWIWIAQCRRITFRSLPCSFAPALRLFFRLGPFGLVSVYNFNTAIVTRDVDRWINNASLPTGQRVFSLFGFFFTKQFISLFPYKMTNTILLHVILPFLFSSLRSTIIWKMSNGSESFHIKWNQNISAITAW